MILALFLALFMGFSPAYSSSSKAGDPVLLKANEITYDEANSKLLARGNILVQSTSNGLTRSLIADKLDYDLKTKRIFASGRVMIFEADGSILQLDEVELTDDFAEGAMKTLRMVTDDRSYIVAEEGERKDGQMHTFKRGSYTPCRLCRVGTVPEPLWQLKATEIEHDAESKTVTYYNARLEFKGIPILYLPYFSHPDPSVKRKSGFLFPTYGVSSSFGKSVSTPYYWAIAPDKDMTFTPIFLEKEGTVYATEYRQRFYNGDTKTAGSYTQTRSINKNQSDVQAFNGPRNPRKERWHVASLSRLDINDERRMVLDVNRASDTTYLSRYPVARQTPSFIQNRNLTSTFTTEQIRDNSYLGLQGFMFQTDAPKTTPFVRPLMRMNVTSDPDKLGGYTSWDSSFLSLERELPVAGRYGNAMNRVSSGLNWRLPYTTRSGQLITTNLAARVDGYDVSRYQRSEARDSTKTERQSARFYPYGNIDWRYPFSKRLGQSQWVMQPTAAYVGSPNNLNNKNIPNEDSNTFELDDVSLFMPNRFDGIDRVDSGHRVIGGLDQTLYFPRQRMFNLFIGQDARLDNRQVVSKDLGEDKKFSDYIIRTKVKPISWLAMRYRTALYRKGLSPRYAEWGNTIGNEDYKFDLGYMFLNKKATVNNQDASQVTGSVKAKVREYWSISWGQVRNLKHNRGGSTLVNYASVNYGDECLKVDFALFKTGYRDRDIRPNTGFLVQLTFKNLGTYAPISEAPVHGPTTMLSQIS